MSVYTCANRSQLQSFLLNYDLGTLESFAGISAGIENTNYFVNTNQGHYVFTIFEQLNDQELPYFLELMTHLAQHKVPIAYPMADKQGQYLQYFADKPATLMRRLQGQTLEKNLPSLEQCQQIGTALAQMHTVTADFHLYRKNNRDSDWKRASVKRLKAYLNNDEIQLLMQELAYQDPFLAQGLPRGVIHADLFRDNALFKGNTLSGMIDFYYACDDIFLYDVAITANAWCINSDHQLDGERLNAFLKAYHQHKAFNVAEQQAWQAMLRRAATRFWLSRLLDLHFPREGELTQTKDPQEFKQILLNHQHLAAECRLPL